MAWFGPKGVATMAFSLLVLSRTIEAGGRIFNIAALAVLRLDRGPRRDRHAGHRWIAARTREDEQASTQRSRAAQPSS